MEEKHNIKLYENKNNTFHALLCAMVGARFAVSVLHDVDGRLMPPVQHDHREDVPYLVARTEVVQLPCWIQERKRLAASNTRHRRCVHFAGFQHSTIACTAMGGVSSPQWWRWWLKNYPEGNEMRPDLNKVGISAHYPRHAEKWNYKEKKKLFYAYSPQLPTKGFSGSENKLQNFEERE